MNPNIILVISFAIAIAGLAWGFYQRGQPVTLEEVVHTAQQAPSVVAVVNEAATTVVQSYENARRKGKLENTPELTKVMNEVRAWLPDWAKLDVTNDQIIQAINSALLIASAATAQINASKAIAAVSHAQPPGPPPNQIPGMSAPDKPLILGR